MKSKQYDRQKLLDEVWATPVTHLAGRYGLSDAGLKKLCSRLQIPTPPRGYWAKLAAGKKVPAKPDLPAYAGATQHLLMPAKPFSTSTYSARGEMDLRLAAVIDQENDPANKIVVSARLNNPHPLVRLTQNALVGAPLDHRRQPVISGRLIHIRVSKPMQARALRIANTLLKTLEKRGYEISLDDNGVGLFFHGLKYSFEFYESCRRVEYQPGETAKRPRKSERYFYAPPWSFLPSGKLILQTRGGYGPKVMDGKRTRIEDLLNAFIVRVAKDGVATLRRNEAIELKEADFARKHQAWSASKERQENEKEKLDALEQDALRWSRAMRLRDYLAAMSDTLSCAEENNAEKRALIEWGSAKADWLDPLIARTDEILDEELEEPRRWLF